jgi:hypothetical protein
LYFIEYPSLYSPEIYNTDGFKQQARERMPEMKQGGVLEKSALSALEV